jgi:hypothetical protein
VSRFRPALPVQVSTGVDNWEAPGLFGFQARRTGGFLVPS